MCCWLFSVITIVASSVLPFLLVEGGLDSGSEREVGGTLLNIDGIKIYRFFFICSADGALKRQIQTNDNIN